MISHAGCTNQSFEKSPFFQTLPDRAYDRYAPYVVVMNGTRLCMARPEEPPTDVEMVALVDVGLARLVAFYGSPTSTVWVPQGHDSSQFVGGEDKSAVVLGLTKRVRRCQ